MPISPRAAPDLRRALGSFVNDLKATTIASALDARRVVHVPPVRAFIAAESVDRRCG